MSAEEFLRGWHALLFLFPGLHPDNALDHGGVEEPWPGAQLVLPGLDEEKRRRFVRSGWPVALEGIGLEAWRRFKAGEIADEDFYCVEAQRAGFQSELGNRMWQSYTQHEPNMTNEADQTLCRLGKNIRVRRTGVKLSRATLAATAQISVAHLSAIERGERSASILCLARVAKALKTSTEKLCEAIDDGTRQKPSNQAK